MDHFRIDTTPDFPDAATGTDPKQSNTFDKTITKLYSLEMYLLSQYTNRTSTIEVNSVNTFKRRHISSSHWFIVFCSLTAGFQK